MITIFGLEHLAKMAHWRIKPSYLLNQLVPRARTLFETIGRMFAHLSRFYHFLGVDQLLETLCDLVMPILQLMLSPSYFVKGYVYVLESLKKHPFITILGSLTLLGAIAFLQRKRISRLLGCGDN